MEFTYFIPTRILFGPGQLNRLHQQELPGKKALIVISSGKSVRENGTLARVEEQLRLAGATSAVFDKILPNPVLRHVMEGAEMAKREGCDFILGLGGGSSIDAAKAIAVMAANPGDYWDYVNGGSGKGQPLPNDPLPIVAVTTTAGTGTEADPWSVTTKEETGEKIGFGCEKTFPVLSVVDPELMKTVPPSLTAYQGFDALFHSTEGYLANIANPISDLFAIKAIELVGRYLARAVQDGSDMEAREGVALANTLAGMVESTSNCVAEHSMEHAMSAKQHELPHGAGLIMISRAFYSYYARSGKADGRMVEMAKALGSCDAKTPMDFVEALTALQKACGVDGLKMSDYGFSKDDLPGLVKNARETMGGLFEMDSVPLSDEDCLKIYEESYR